MFLKLAGRHSAVTFEKLAERSLVRETELFGHVLHAVGWIEQTDFRFFYQAFADELVGCLAIEFL